MSGVLQAVRLGRDSWLIPVCFRRQWERLGWRMISPPPEAPDALARPVLLSALPAPEEPPPAPVKRRRGRPKGSKTRRGRGNSE